MINCRAVIFSMDPLPSQSGAGGTQSSLRGCSQQCRGHKSSEQHSFIQHQPSTSCVLHQVIYSTFMVCVCEKDYKVVPWENGNSMSIFTLGLLFRLFAISIYTIQLLINKITESMWSMSLLINFMSLWNKLLNSI